MSAPTRFQALARRPESVPLRAASQSREPLLPKDVPLIGFGNEDQTDDEGHQRHHDRIPEPEIDVAGLSHHCEGRRGQKAAEPTVADVVRQRQAGIADARREELDKRRGDQGRRPSSRR